MYSKVTENPDKINNEMSFEEREKELKAKEEAEERNKKSRFNNFVQWNNSKDIFLMEQKLIKESPTASRVFRFLVHHMDKTNAVMVSYNTIGDFLESSRTTIYRAIKKLEDENFIDVYKSGASNIYAINHNIAWRTHGDKMHFSKFKANVIISASEQDKERYEKIKKEYYKQLKEVE